MEIRERYTQASVKTASDLRTVARSSLLRDLTHLSLPQIDAIVDLVARLVPAGNVPGMILNGLARLRDRRLPRARVRQDIALLFQGVAKFLDRAVYAAFFAGPAAVIWGYQQLLRLAGKDLAAAFPDGPWQFYVEYALREDSARHANETHGFDTALRQHGIRLSRVDRITAWTMAAIYCLHDYDRLLENEWRERVYTFLLQEVTAGRPEATRYARLYQEWFRQIPYGRTAESAPDEPYPLYRRRRFDRFLQPALDDLPADLYREWERRVQAAEADDLPAYQKQMSLLAFLDPGPYSETRTPLRLEQAHVGLVLEGTYALIPACAPQSERPADPHTVRSQVAALLAAGPTGPTLPLAPLARISRSAWPDLRAGLSTEVVAQLDALRLAPILLNCDPRPRRLPLAELRQAERGIGDHPLTILDTGESFVLDQSHIFFDGAWGAALAEILTNEALSWAVYLNGLPPAQPGQVRPYTLAFPLSDDDRALLERAPRIAPEAAAESDAVDMPALLRLRRVLKQRSEKLALTVNDLLILYRALHAVTYEPSPTLLEELEALARSGPAREAAQTALQTLERSRLENPAILIPIDASRRSPRDRLYPMTFEVPLNELDLIARHELVLAELDTYRRSGQAEARARFEEKRRQYLGMLSGFGQVLNRAKEYGMIGESGSVGALRLLAHLPEPLQRMLDQIPGRFDVLNDIIKGREVFSNVGAVAPSSTLSRFITARDDNEKKALAWGVLTDARGVMHLSLRDFRPHVGLLAQAGRIDLATRITQEYLDAYVAGLNRFVRELEAIALAGHGVAGPEEQGRPAPQQATG